ncbi:restriction endonuclease subunit S [Methyloversatilis discipulorum]|uniref:restriction endonuclease subunit S n=1 Tax=Methyloversatilis discipulorum TaxID=1119528 RepID=UPI0031376FAD
MSSEWRQGRLGDFIELKRGYDLPKEKRLNGPYPLVSSSGVSDRHSEAMVRAPGVVTGRYGTIGQVFFVDQDFWPLNTTLYVRDFKGNDPKFISYFLKTLDFFAYSDKAAVPGVNRNHLHEASVSLPGPKTQFEIAACLGALDDRIALLRETNATLEAIAQALFKSWFVDFDPVRARMEGRAPEGMDDATAALFPDSFEESELGLVPKGWPTGRLQDLLILQRGFDLPAASRTEGAYPLIAASGQNGTHDVAMALAPGVVTGRSGVLGKVFLVLEDYWPLNTTLWIKEFKHSTPCYAFELLKRLDFASFNAGSAVPTLNRNHIHGLPYLLPPRDLIRAYEAVAMALHRRALENSHQAQTLATLRDTLLPRLISGQLRLPDAEACIEEAMA